MSQNIDPRSGLPTADSDKARFRTNLIRVLTVQVVALALLYLLQYTFRP